MHTIGRDLRTVSNLQPQVTAAYVMPENFVKFTFPGQSNISGTDMLMDLFHLLVGVTYPSSGSNGHVIKIAFHSDEAKFLEDCLAEKQRKFGTRMQPFKAIWLGQCKQMTQAHFHAIAYPNVDPNMDPDMEIN